MNLPGWHPDFHRSPLFAGLENLATAFSDCHDWPDLDRLNHLAAERHVRNAAGLPLRFEAQTLRLGQADYEARIHTTGVVPTRERDWHDFFNALIWLAWPRAKAALNAAQRDALDSAGKAGRGPLSDALTLFDESGLVLVAADPTLAGLLKARRWKAAFWEQRPRWRDARIYVIGHSLLEKALEPPPGVTGKCLYLAMDGATPPDALDPCIAAAWNGAGIARPADLFPVPLFGVPGYAAGNRDPIYYEDAGVFRPPRG